MHAEWAASRHMVAEDAVGERDVAHKGCAPSATWVCSVSATTR
jgi:hypothetical protein